MIDDLNSVTELDFMTAMETYEFLRDRDLSPMIKSDDHLREFIAACSANRYVFTSRADDGTVRSVMFGWPIPSEFVEGYDGDPDIADNECGRAFYSALVVADTSMPNKERMRSLMGMRDLIRLRFGKDFELMCYHKMSDNEAYKVTRF